MTTGPLRGNRSRREDEQHRGHNQISSLQCVSSLSGICGAKKDNHHNCCNQNIFHHVCLSASPSYLGVFIRTPSVHGGNGFSRLSSVTSVGLLFCITPGRHCLHRKSSRAFCRVIVHRFTRKTSLFNPLHRKLREIFLCYPQTAAVCFSVALVRWPSCITNMPL